MESYAPDNIKWVVSNDILFNSSISINDLTEKDFQLMDKIEGVKLYDKKTGALQSKTGIISLTQISTGLKTLLNIRHIKRKNIKDVGVNITEAGSNVLDYIFEEVSDGSIPVLLKHWDVLSCKDRYVEINGKDRVKTMKKLYNYL